MQINGVPKGVELTPLEKNRNEQEQNKSAEKETKRNGESKKQRKR